MDWMCNISEASILTDTGLIHGMTGDSASSEGVLNKLYDSPFKCLINNIVYLVERWLYKTNLRRKNDA
jgi:hypothetical protein